MSHNPNRVARRTHRVFFAALGNGPWACYCGDGEVVSLGRSSRDGNIHHLDGDASNDVPENLVIMHVDCHQRFHGPPSDNARMMISAKLKGRTSPTKGMKLSEETRMKMSNAQIGDRNSFFGKHHTNESLIKMRKPRVRMICDDCGGMFAKNWINRHKKEGRCTKQLMSRDLPEDSL